MREAHKVVCGGGAARAMHARTGREWLRLCRRALFFFFRLLAAREMASGRSYHRAASNPHGRTGWPGLAQGSTRKFARYPALGEGPRTAGGARAVGACAKAAAGALCLQFVQKLILSRGRRAVWRVAGAAHSVE